MRLYRVHTLVEVRVDAAVKDHVRAGIDFQLGHFRAADPAAPSAPGVPQVRFLPYAAYQDRPTVHFHLARGRAGRSLHAPASRYAVEVTADGYSIFSDTGETLVNLVVQLAVLRQGMTFLHAAGWVDPRGVATLLPGPGGVGKTALLSAGVLRHGLSVLGDDLVLVGQEARAASFPRAFVLKPYHRSQFPHHFPTGRRHQRAWLGPVVRFAQENVPFRGVLKHLARRAGRLEATSLWMQQGFTGPDLFPVPVATLFGADRVASGGRVGRVIYLERHDGTEFEEAELPLDTLVARSLAVLQHEWVDFGRWFNQMAALELFSLPDYMRSVDLAIRSACGSAERALVRIPAHATPEELEAWFARRFGFAERPT
jgi:hypothetical protein